MQLRLKLAAATAAIMTLTAAGAQAATLYQGPSSMPERAVDNGFDVTFNAPAGAAQLSFVLDGYASLDGQNWYEDDFSLSLNGAQIILATFNLGGGGPDVIYSAPVGAAFDNTSGNGTAVTWAGGHVTIASPLTLAAGANTLTFNYHALTSDHAGWQDMGDEGWGAHDILVTNRAVSQDIRGGVPEPSMWLLSIVGFGLMGSMLRRQRAMQPIRVRA
jgi:hypothetical protein